MIRLFAPSREVRLRDMPARQEPPSARPTRPRPVLRRRGATRPAAAAKRAAKPVPPAAKAPALAAAWEFVSWAVADGRSIQDIFRDADLPVPRSPTLADAVVALAEQWKTLQEPGRDRAERARLDRLSKLGAAVTPITPIVDVVCAEMEIDPETLFSGSKARPAVAARREILVRALALTPHSLIEVAGWLGIDRSTAIYHRSVAQKEGRVAAIQRATAKLPADIVPALDPAAVRRAASLLGAELAALGHVAG